MRDADTHARTKEMIEALKREAKKIQDDIVYGTGENKYKSLTGAFNTSYGTGFWVSNKFASL